MDYCPNTTRDTADMLKAAGASSVEDLFRDIPAGLRTGQLKLPDGLSEQEVLARFAGLSGKNAMPSLCFAGGGMYDHHIPSVVDALSGRSEFYTAYTPYQPECSQGTLQALFEYQTAICRLTGLDVSNASLYDGGTAVAEAVLMAVRITGRSRVIVDGSVNPLYRQVLETYLTNRSLELLTVKPDGDAADRNAIRNSLNDNTACVVVQNPNFFGSLDNAADIAQMAHDNGSLLIMAVYPISLGMVRSPAEQGADIAVGDGQSLGMPLSFGGPTVGFITAKMQYVRNLPGRIIGETVDSAGRRGFVLTLQAREQHIKRQKATSNICSNQSLCALRALIFLSAYGREGFQELARQNRDKSEFAKKKLSGIKGVKIWNKRPTFNEFVLTLPKKCALVVKKLLSRNILAGIPLDDHRLLVAVTETRSRAEILKFAGELEKILWK